MQLVKIPAPRLPGMTRATRKSYAEQLASMRTGANALLALLLHRHFQASGLISLHFVILYQSIITTYLYIKTHSAYLTE